MDIYDSDDITVYRINLKWMKRKMMILTTGDKCDEIYDNTWYHVASKHSIQLVTKSIKLEKIKFDFSIMPTKIIRKSIPNICITQYEYLIILSNTNGYLFYYYYDSFFKRLNKCAYNRILKIKLGLGKFSINK